jgi:hypothetical protein
MSIKKEPPDKYRCFKLPISHILFRENDEDEGKKKEVEKQMLTLQNAIIRTNSITSKTYFLLRLWVLV